MLWRGLPLPFLSRHVTTKRVPFRVLRSLSNSRSSSDTAEGAGDQPQRVAVVLDEGELREQFIRGSGRGGQKINKTSSCVQLRHEGTGVVVKCQATRSLAQNRRIARKRMAEALDARLNGEMSRAGQRAKEERDRKRRRRKRAAKKYHGGQGGAGAAGGQE